MDALVCTARGSTAAPSFVRMAALLMASGRLIAGSEPFHPTSENAVVETLGLRVTAAEDRALKDRRARVQQAPEDSGAALALGRDLILRARREGDLRYTAQALAVVKPWAEGNSPLPEALVLQATVFQSLHEFDNALASLDRALGMDPKHVQAWPTKATIHMVRSEFDAARKACLVLTRLGAGFPATVATAQLATLTGNARQGYQLLQRLNQEANVGTPLPVDQRAWVQTLLAETAARLGDIPAARAHFDEALHTTPEDPYLLGAYADFLLDQGDPDKVIDRLYKYPRNDALLLRVAEAGSRRTPVDESTVREQVRELGSRFEAARRRGDSVHRREEARFRLRLCADPQGALRLAQENWGVQKEPADARILLEAAETAGDAAAVSAVLNWVRAHKLEDVKLQRPGATSPSLSPSP